MNKLFEVILRHDGGESKFVNCSIENAIGIIQTDLFMRGMPEQFTVPIFWDIVFNRLDGLKIDLYDLVNTGQISIKKTYR